MNANAQSFHSAAPLAETAGGAADGAATLAPNLAHLRRHGGTAAWTTSAYTVEKLIGAGAMGAVLLARERPEAPRVAMKVMNPRGGADAARRFLEEAAITRALQHPNVIPIYDVGVNGFDQLFYTMKLVEGGTLRGVLETLRRREPQALGRYHLRALLAIFLKICDGVAYAHHRGVLHLDLKPENVLLGEFGEVYVADWGLALFWKRDATAMKRPHPRSETSAGGTPGYMSPEQAWGGDAAVDERSDVFALGAILYQLITLDRPFAGGDASAVLANVRAGAVIPPAPRIRTLRAADQTHLPADILPELLVGVATKALSPMPESRPSGVPELQREVESCF